MTGPWGAPGPHLRAFRTRKIRSRGYFFGVFLKSVILSKSCSRCGGSTIFKGRALQKSVRDPVRSGVRKKHGQKRTCRALRGRLGALPENRPSPGRPTRRPKNFKKGSPELGFLNFLDTFFDLLACSSLGDAPGGPRDRFLTFFRSISE